MTQQARIRGEVCFRAGDGPLMTIPPGPVEIDVGDDSVTLGWNAATTAWAPPPSPATIRPLPQGRQHPPASRVKAGGPIMPA
jgi:hypothetical protein